MAGPGLYSPLNKFARNNRKIDRANQVLQTVAPTVRLVAGAAGLAGLAAVVAAAKIAQKPFDNNIAGKRLIFPSDLENYSISMAFDFLQYERRSIFRQPYKKPVGTIRLPIAKNIKDSFTMTWDPTEQKATVGAAMETLLSSGSVARALTGEGATGVGDYVGNLVGSLGATATGLASGLALDLGKNAGNQIGDILQKIAPGVGTPSLSELLQPLGLAENPFMTVLFKSPTFKEFQFSWRLAPRTPEESAEINSIINMFKYYMLPDIPGGRALGGTMLGYPSMVQIGFFGSDDYLFRFKPCVIKNMTVNYAPASTPSFFKGSKNVPTEIDLSLNLLEIEYWTRQDFKVPDKNDTGGYIPGV